MLYFWKNDNHPGMKKAIAFITLIAAACYITVACEKDDICSEGTPTTPSVIVEFFYNDNRSVVKPANFLYYVPGVDVALGGVSASKIQLPLRTDQETTTWAIELRTPTGGNTFIVNKDLLTFNYTNQQVYVSRACGFRNVFFLDQANPVTYSDNPVPDNLWIQDIDVETLTIENENETHVKIYF